MEIITIFKGRFDHRAYKLKISCDFVVRVEPPRGVGGWGPDFRLISDFGQILNVIRILRDISGN